MINCNEYATLVGNADNGRGYAWVGAWNIWEISALYTQFSCEPKTALKNVYFFKKGKSQINKLTLHLKEVRKKDKLNPNLAEETNKD